jgi:hypothetical protein
LVGPCLEQQRKHWTSMARLQHLASRTGSSSSSHKFVWVLVKFMTSSTCSRTLEIQGSLAL